VHHLDGLREVALPAVQLARLVVAVDLKIRLAERADVNELGLTPSTAGKDLHRGALHALRVGRKVGHRTRRRFAHLPIDGDVRRDGHESIEPVLARDEVDAREDVRPALGAQLEDRHRLPRRLQPRRALALNAPRRDDRREVERAARKGGRID
jgi:hypothetical protein